MRTSWCAAVLLVSALPARAQNPSDLMPPPPPAPKGGGYYYPGMPVPQAEPAARAPSGERGVSGGKAADDKRPGPTGFYVDDDEGGGAEESEVSTGGPPPETYVVRKGDTLWGISSTYFRNPWAWPQLWSYNPSITNPHWIYPGDILHLTAPGQAPPPAISQPLAQTHKLGAIPLPAPRAIYFRQYGFVEAQELKTSGTIVGSKEEKIMLATLDEAYVDFSPQTPLEVNARYTVFKPIRKVKHPVTGEYLGEMVEIFGEADVKSLTPGHIARVQIVASTDGIERGFRVGPLKRELRVPESRPAKADLAGVIVTTVRPTDLVGAHIVVFIDRGKRDGVELGNRFLIVRRGDGYQPLLSKGPVDDARFPREDVGELIVIEVRDRLSTCLVLHTTKEARYGDRVEARKGF